MRFFFLKFKNFGNAQKQEVKKSRRPEEFSDIFIQLKMYALVSLFKALQQDLDSDWQSFQKCYNKHYFNMVAYKVLEEIMRQRFYIIRKESEHIHGIECRRKAMLEENYKRFCSEPLT